MCGIWGFSGTAPDISVLKDVATRASRRGPDAWGAVWTSGEQLCEHREIGALADSAWNFDALAGATAVMGHARLATSGAAKAIEDTQPLSAGDIAIAHNGNVYHHAQLAQAMGATLTTGCDSELLLAAVKTHGINPGAVSRAVALMGSTPFALMVIDASGAFAVGCSGQPLFSLTRKEGMYFGQAPFEGAVAVDPGCMQFINGGTMSDTTRPPQHPISSVRWIDPNLLHANNYNPNKVFPPEFALLKVSILEDGWTQPVVVNPDTMNIIDGFHRWTLASNDAEIKAVSNGLVPVVFVNPVDEASQRMSTVRHNRARGSHGIVAMGHIVRDIKDSGVGNDEISRRLGMEDEEIERLTDFRASTDKMGQDSFGKGWVPTAKKG